MYFVICWYIEGLINDTIDMLQVMDKLAKDERKIEREFQQIIQFHTEVIR